MFNRLLNKQIRRKLGGVENIPPEMMELLTTINDSYEHYEKDRFIIERALELELKETKFEKEAEKLKAKADFLSTMSHEIRTPLNAVIGITNILLMETKDQSSLENLNTLKFSADSLLSLINNILDFSKLDRGQLAFDKSEFNIKHLVENLQKSFFAKTQSIGIDLLLDIDERIPNTILGDSHRLCQILFNLVGNSTKFTQEGYIKLEIKIANIDQDNVSLHFSIIDTGIGIEKNKFDLIFENFAQADKNTARRYGGTGLGLPITKKLVELMGSHIELESEIGVGSKFSFTLEFELAKKTASRAKSLDDTETIFNKQRILLVDDNKINLMIAKRFLEKWNLEVITALDGKIALDKVQVDEFHLILMDLNMPVMDGFESTKAIRALSDENVANLPIIALTASTDNASRSKISEYSMNAFVGKPFEPKELNKVIGKFLEADKRDLFTRQVSS